MAKVSRGTRGRSAAATVADAAAPSRNAAPTAREFVAARAGGQVADLGGKDPPHAARVADRQDPAAPPGHPLQGYIDEASSSRITGWVWNPQQPDSTIALEVVDGDTRLAKVMANQYRS